MKKIWRWKRIYFLRGYKQLLRVLLLVIVSGAGEVRSDCRDDAKGDMKCIARKSENNNTFGGNRLMITRVTIQVSSL